MQAPTKKGVLYLFALLVLISSCQTPDAADIARRVGRPVFPNPCLSNGDGTCFRNGELENTENMICGTPEEYDEIQTYIEDQELRLYICLRNSRRCD
jgi:hypothetical protein